MLQSESPLIAALFPGVEGKQGGKERTVFASFRSNPDPDPDPNPNSNPNLPLRP